MVELHRQLLPAHSLLSETLGDYIAGTIAHGRLVDEGLIDAFASADEVDVSAARVADALLALGPYLDAETASADRLGDFGAFAAFVRSTAATAAARRLTGAAR